jgi:hypothetical protein
MTESLEPLLHDEPPSSVRVTYHCELMYLARCDAEEPFPRGRIRDLWNRSEPAPDHPAARQGDGLFLIYDVRRQESVILTIYPTSGGGGP